MTIVPVILCHETVVSVQSPSSCGSVATPDNTDNDLRKALNSWRIALSDTKPIVVAPVNRRMAIATGLMATGIRADVLLMPLNRGSAAAVAAACLKALARDRRAIVVIVSGTPWIEDGVHHAAVSVAARHADDGYLVTVGGYSGQPVSSGSNSNQNTMAVHAPAMCMVCRAGDFIKQLRLLETILLGGVARAFSKAIADGIFILLDKAELVGCPVVAVAEMIAKGAPTVVLSPETLMPVDQKSNATEITAIAPGA